MSTEQLDPDLGPVKIQLTSRFLLIAGFLQISVLIPSVTRKVRLDDITVSLIERVKLESYKRPGIKEIKPDRTTRLCSLIEDRRSEPISLEPGAGFSTREQFRIPIFAVSRWSSTFCSICYRSVSSLTCRDYPPALPTEVALV